MSRNFYWKLALVVLVFAWGLYEMNPPVSRDLMEYFQERALRPDAAFSNIVHQALEFQKERPERKFANLRQAIGTNDITKYFPFYPEAKEELNPTSHILNRLQRDAAGRIKLGLDLQGGTSFLVKLDTSKLMTTDTVTNAQGQVQTITNNVDAELEGVIEHAVEVLRKRVDKFGVAEPVIQPSGRDRILVQLPGLSEADKESAKTTIQKVAFLEFRLVHESNDQLLQTGEIPPGYELLKRKARKQSGAEKLEQAIVKKKPERGLTGNIVKSAIVVRGNLGQPEIDFALTTEGAAIFGEVTSANVGRRLAIVLDGELYSAPVIQSAIETGRGQITGQFDLREAFELSNVLENPLKVPLQIEEERTVDPSLGKDAIASGVIASMVAAVATFLFMLVFYFGLGLVANLALVLNVVLLMGAMCALGSTLTMPGIAGIALTIGMAVDANVLIYERMREELAAGKSIRGVVTAAYSKAFGTIFDSNLTTLIAAVILIKFGTGPVQGFGVTLAIGIIASMFTALFVTRLIYDFLLAKGWMRNARMMPLARFKRIPFMSWGKLAYIISAVLILIGAGSGIARGKKVLGVDFAGGEAMTLTFSQRVGEDQLRDTLDKAALGDAAIGYQKSLSTGAESLQVVVPEGAGAKAEAALKEAFPQAEFDVKGTDVVGATVGKEIQRSAIIASLIALFAILAYVAFRYEFSFAVASVLALIHDVVLTMGIYFLSGRQLTAPMVAAILTIIGYSINDKIVIMDRIREDLKLGVRGSFRELIDIALNQTLSRTIITGGAVILATLSLLFLGGGVINDFAFTFLVGTLAGTYSSLLIASPFVLWWHKGERPKIGSGAQVTVPGAAATAASKA
jgi:SecD/SecF fusion protein